MSDIPGQVFDLENYNHTLVGMIQKINKLTDVGQGGILGIFILLVVGGPLFMMMRSAGNERAFPATMVVLTLLAFFLRSLSLISDVVFWITISLLIVSVLLLIREQGLYE